MASLRNYKLTIKAGEKIEFGLRGSMVRIVRASVPLYFASRNDDANFYLVEGEEARLEGGAIFTALDIWHDSGAEQSVVLAVGENAYMGSARVSGSVSISSPVNSAGSNTQKTVTSASGSLVAANPVRKFLAIQNKDTSGKVYINFGAAATVANGLLIPAGGYFELNANMLTAEIFAIGDIANNANVVVVEG